MTKASSAEMVVAKDDWVTAAMTDNQMVVELLLRLNQAKTMTADSQPLLLPPSRWGVRQRRSRSSRFAGCSVKKEADSVRGSPVTPLSWSGGSRSGGCSADGFEETSRQASCSTSATGSGSKALPANEITSSLSNRSKKTKTFSELKHEETFLLKERFSLENEIATMRTTITEQSARNENLKRIKLDLNSDCARPAIQHYPVSKSDLYPRKHENCLVEEEGEEAVSDGCRGGKTGCCEGGLFLLPDLNTTPPEDDACTETLYGTS
ncbi:PREDICTED: uncharacterized protein LOC104803849 [Tarenaya hassleriana]|uniref:uncharacterized protein LOC104803849 n=1 Tax=Tarenaya hassleriana TaxID=28532 RepID=UPI00053C5B99|nr:PREDICTED: uncharacterized protein LOC104803849 [Tarenaya hassleriana]